jgi:hypothetical protein
LSITLDLGKKTIYRRTLFTVGRSSGSTPQNSGLPISSQDATVTKAIVLRVSCPYERQGSVTAAGPLPIFTGFPIIARWGDRLCVLYLSFTTPLYCRFFKTQFILEKIEDQLLSAIYPYIPMPWHGRPAQQMPYCCCGL